MAKENHKYTNALSVETSPYLLQHAHNPVNWLPWGAEARQKATSENKLMLISVGYSACHWCHVMERESFEDEEVAQIMNDNFVCVKVDREERPDVDQVYMDAVQMIRKQGGWPLNCFTTPDGKPVYGGTYYPKAQWIDILHQLAELWLRTPKDVQDYGDKMADGMQVSGTIAVYDPAKIWDAKNLTEALKNWNSRMDFSYGGPDKAPKFPLPANYIFLLQYGIIKNDKNLLNHVELTLDKMAQGGIYDQVGGGFTRYSTDKFWKVPHFEKMLYDNAQLLTLYAEAYKFFKKSDYLHISKGITEWLRREMAEPNRSFFSALDADSEGIEGKFYTFETTELSDYGLLDAYSQFYFTDQRALWEERLIPVRKNSFRELAIDFNLSENDVIAKFDALNEQLLAIRSKRIRPLTDDKTLCSWNAMLAGGLLKTYRLEGDEKALKDVKGILQFIDNHFLDTATGQLSHSWKEGNTGDFGFLEDYAFVISAWIDYYQATFDENALQRAREFTNTALDQFYDKEKGFFYFTSSTQTDLINRPVELSDNVIPSSNSVMARSLHTLASYFSLPYYFEIANRLLSAVEKSMVEYPEGYGNWAGLYLQNVLGSPELVIIGENANAYYEALKTGDLSYFVLAVSEKKSSLPIFANRYQAEKTLIYLCQNQACLQPLESVDSALIELNRLRKKFENP